MKTRWIVHLHIHALSFSSVESSMPHLAVHEQKVRDLCGFSADQGVRVGMPITKAQRLVKQAHVVPYDHVTHDLAANAVSEVLWRHTPWVECITPQEWFFAIPAATGDDAVREAQSHLRELSKLFQSGLQRATAGLSTNKLSAKAATLLAYEGRATRLTPERVWTEGPCTLLSVVDSTQFVPQLPIRYLWPLSSSIRQQLRHLGVLQVFHLRHIAEQQLMGRFGKEALLWLPYARGIDHSPLVVNYPSPSRKAEWKTKDGWIGSAQMMPMIDRLCEKLAMRLCMEQEGCQHIEVIIASDDASVTLERHTTHLVSDAYALYANIEAALATEGTLTQIPPFITAISLHARELRPIRQQQLSLDLWNDQPHSLVNRHTSIDRVMRQLAKKYPKHPISRGMTNSPREMRLSWFDPLRSHS